MNFHQAPTTYVGEVVLNVQDLNRSLEFYTTVIGFTVLKKTENKAVLTADGSTPLVTIIQPEGVRPKEPRRTGLFHYALLLPERSDLGAIIPHLVRHGVRLGSSDHDVSEALYLSDPDGNGIEIYRDRHPSEWSWKDGQVKMVTDPLDAEGVLQAGEGKEWNGLPKGTIMGHVHLHVSDLAETEDFYKALGFEVVTTYPQALFMSSGHYHHHLGLNTWNGAGAPRPSENTVGLVSYDIVYPTAEERERAVENITKLGAKVSELNGVVHTEDPSGNGIVMKVGA